MVFHRGGAVCIPWDCRDLGVSLPDVCVRNFDGFSSGHCVPHRSKLKGNDFSICRFCLVITLQKRKQ